MRKPTSPAAPSASGSSPRDRRRRARKVETSGSATPPLVTEMLQECRLEILGAMKPYLTSGAPAAYLYDLTADYPGRGGKMMRPGICIATARAFGAKLPDVLRSAVAIELLHNAFLVHDDIEDESELRRGAPSLHALHGVPLALNAGDAMLLLALRPLLDNRKSLGANLALKVLDEAERMARESAEGQAMELGWRRDNVMDLSDDDYFLMVLKKTAWLGVIHPMRVGALIGTRGRADVEPFIRFGFFLGAAFQIQDDLLNLADADQSYGKESLGDLLEGKRTLMLIHTFRNGAKAERDRMKAILATPRFERRESDIRWLRDLMETHGSLDTARRIAHGLAGAALHEFDALFGSLKPSRDTDFLRGLVTWVFERT
jgi:geranylgeranyl diphosphate synthase, type II